MPTSKMRLICGAALSLATLSGVVGPAIAQERTKSPPGAKVYFIEPQNGASASQKVTVKFGLVGMGVAPAGVDKPNTGHHHLMIDAAGKVDYGKPLPMDATHRHFGAGQTEAVIELPPGEHKLQLLMADKNHIPHDPPVESPVITVTVK